MGLTLGQSLESFESYNQAIWPMQLVAYVLGTAAVLLAVRKSGISSRGVLGILGFLWLWTGTSRPAL